MERCMGSLIISSPTTTLPTSALSVISVGGVAFTTMTSVVAAPTSSLASKRFIAAATRMMLLLLSSLKPCAETVTTYVPGNKSGKLYSPLLFVAVACCTFVATSVAVTLAATTTAPRGSFTVPVIEPWTDCAKLALLASQRQTRLPRAILRNLSMRDSSHFPDMPLHDLLNIRRQHVTGRSTMRLT